MNATDVTTRLEFWGTTVDVESCAADADELRFFYGTYLSGRSGGADASVSIRCLDWPARGFFASSLAGDGLMKSISVNDHHEPRRSVEARFSDWSDVVSPFPPLATSKLATRMATFPGAVVRGRNGAVTALVGDHYVGKTATAIALCRHQGAELISDGIIVLDTHARVCLTYQSPLGLRRESLKRMLPILNALEHRLTVSRDTGLVALVRPPDILGADNAAGGRIDHLVLLSSRRPSDRAKWTRQAPIRIAWFTEAEDGAVQHCLPTEMHVLEASPDTSPTERARLVSERLHVGAQ